MYIIWDLPGSPVVKTVCFNCRGHKLNPWAGNKDSSCQAEQPGKKEYVYTMVRVTVAQSCPTLRNPLNYTVHGILQVRILESVAFPFSRGSSQPRDQTQVSHIAGRFFTS